MPEITLDHIRQAAEWAAKSRDEATPIDGLTRRYDQSDWDCGTACCMWGAASILAGCGPAKSGPPEEWSGADLLHTLVAGVLRSGNGTPSQIQQLLSDANLSDADLSGANLSGANLSGANLSDANLSDANLSDANLSGANLSGANLSGANLSGANLSGANLSDADLSDANLSDANLSGANLSGANLSDANLSDANLSGATVSIGNVTRKIEVTP